MSCRQSLEDVRNMCKVDNSRVKSPGLDLMRYIINRGRPVGFFSKDEVLEKIADKLRWSKFGNRIYTNFL